MKKFVKRSLAVLGIVVLAIGLAAGYVVATHNFHEVSPGKVYRSNQMSGAALNRAIARHNVKSVLNLRGANPQSAWYCEETNVTHQAGVQHLDFRMSARRELTDGEMETVLGLIREAPKPLLIHCQAGADRTGLVTALYLYSIEGQSAAAAERALSWRYLHFPHLFWRDTVAMDVSFRRYTSNHFRNKEL